MLIVTVEYVEGKLNIRNKKYWILTKSYFCNAKNLVVPATKKIAVGNVRS